MSKYPLNGNEADVSSERARRLVPLLVRRGDGEVVRISAETLSKDPGRLADEAQAISMFADKRLTWIEVGGRDARR